MVADDINSSSGSAFQNKKIRTWVTATDASAGGDSSDKIFKMPERMTKTCHRWGVVTTIFDPNEAITRVTDMPSWCLVIVPDTKTPLDYMDKLETLLLQQRTTSTTATIMKENIFYFSIDKQKEWEEVEGPFGTFVQLIPWKHFSRKNIGYLFAILHGAKYIFDFDDDNFIKLDEDGKPLQLLPAGDEPSAMTLKDVNIIMQGANVFNHHPIMGASLDDSWPRGFPIEMILNNNTRGQVAFTNDVKFHHHGKEIGVIQFLADGNPDIDALHRLSKPLPMTFPLEGAKSALVPSHAYAPYNAQATIHTKNAMWAMLLPGTVPGRVSDIWRSYFAQCIFADAGLRVVFSPPKIVQERNDHEYLGDFNAEEDLYVKSGKLVEFLSEWDSDDSDTIPKRMKKLWIDLYEYGYIEKDDVYTVQAWLGALEQIGYTFPPLKRRYRNIAVLGQFNYADAPTVVDDVIFWVQKQKESFVTVIAAGPFNDKQMTALKGNFIDAISNRKDNRGKSNTRGKMRPGYFTPLENLKDVVLRFKGSNKIEGVLYAHDDGILNITELSEGGRYPFPTHNFIATGRLYLHANTPSSKLGRNRKKTLKMNAYRIFPDGHFEDFFKKHKYSSFYDLKSGVPLGDWFHRDKAWCIQGQVDLAKDPDSFRYRETDGSILFPPGAQADFFFVPTDYAEEFALAADLHLKHGIFIECAFNAIMHMVWMKTNATVRSVGLCTEWSPKYRGTVSSLSECLDKSRITPFGFIHPFKICENGYKSYDYYYDEAQMMELL